MEKPNIAIVGLGRVGSAFLEQLLGGGKAINLVAAAELLDTPGKARAAAAGVRIASIDDLVAIGDGIDVIFDLTGNPQTRKELREKLAASDNRYTVIAPETVARVIWAFIDKGELPVIEGRKTGY